MAKKTTKEIMYEADYYFTTLAQELTQTKYNGQYIDYINALVSLHDVFRQVKDETFIGFNPLNYIQLNENVEKIKRMNAELFGNKDLSKLPKDEQEVYYALKGIEKHFDTEPFKVVLSDAQRHTDFYNDLKNGSIENEIQERVAHIDEYYEKPSIEDCLNMSVNDTDVSKIAKFLFWGALQSYVALGIDQECNSIYAKTYVRIVEDMKQAPLAVQSELARELIIQGEAVKDIAYKKLQEIRKDFPQEEYKDIYELRFTKEFAMADSMNTLRTEFSHGPVAEEMVEYVLPPRGEEALISKRESNEIGDIISQTYFKASKKYKDLDDPNNPRTIEVYQPIIKEAGFTDTSDLTQLIELYQDILDTEDIDSKNLTPVKEAFQKFMNLDHSKDCGSDKYFEALDEAIASAEGYRDTHKGIIITGIGRERAAKSKEIAQKLGAYKDVLLTRNLNELKYTPENDFLKAKEELTKCIDTDPEKAKLCCAQMLTAYVMKTVGNKVEEALASSPKEVVVNLSKLYSPESIKQSVKDMLNSADFSETLKNVGMEGFKELKQLSDAGDIYKDLIKEIHEPKQHNKETIISEDAPSVNFGSK